MIEILILNNTGYTKINMNILTILFKSIYSNVHITITEGSYLKPLPTSCLSVMILLFP